MIKPLIDRVISTDSIPVIGGSAGAVAGSLPTHDMVITTVILAIIGALVGYLVKIGLDRIVKYRKDKKNKGPNVEFRSFQ